MKVVSDFALKVPMTKADPSHPQKKGQAIVRDPGFVRLIADNVIVANLGRDIEISLLVVGGRLSRQMQLEPTGHDEIVYHSFERINELSETGRVRMNPYAALNASMNIIEMLISSDQIDVDELKKSIDGMIEKTRGAVVNTSEENR